MDEELKDWKGDPIEVGARVLYSGERAYSRWIGVVTDIKPGDPSWITLVRADIEIDANRVPRKRSQFVQHVNLTVIN